MDAWRNSTSASLGTRRDASSSSLGQEDQGHSLGWPLLGDSPLSIPSCCLALNVGPCPGPGRRGWLPAPTPDTIMPGLFLRHPAQVLPRLSLEFLKGLVSSQTGSRCMPGDASSGKSGTLASMRRQRETRIKRVASGSIPAGSTPRTGPTVSTCQQPPDSELTQAQTTAQFWCRLKSPWRQGHGASVPITVLSAG